ncbi:MAG: glycosyltransferase, partial [Bacteroidota bacterium]
QEKMGENIPSTTGNLLTVAVPFYNMGDYIEECVQSVFESTYQPIRILIIDDGSTDKASLDKLEILSRDERIDIFRQENAGLAAARNNGALKAKGDFLAFLDADDKVCPDYYEKAIGVMKHLDNVFFVGSWVRYFGNSTRLWPTFTPQPPYALVHNPVNSSGLVYKRAAFLLGGLNDKRTDYGLEDYESLVNMLHHGYNGVVLPEPLFHYRVRTGSMFRKITREKLMYSNKYIAEKHKVYYAKFAVQIINLLNANGPGFQFDNPSFGVQVRTAAGKDSRFAGKLKSVIKKNDRLKRIVVRIKNKFNL